MPTELQQIADEAARLLDAPVTVEDRNFNLVAHASQQDGLDPIRQASILARRSTPQVRAWFEQFGIATSSGPLRTPAGPQVRSRLCLPARWRGVTYGYIWVLDETRALTDPAVRQATELADHAAAYLAQQDRQRENEAALLDDLLAADRDTAASAAGRLVEIGAARRGRPVVTVEVGLFVPPAPVDVTVNLWPLPRPILSSSSAHTTTLLVPLRDEQDLAPAHDAATRVLELYGQRMPPAGMLSAGVGGVCADLLEAGRSRREAQVAARVAATVTDRGPVALWSELGAFRLLAADARVDLAALVVDDAAHRLLAQPELAQTVRVYLDMAGHAQRAASRLHIHRQTLYYRLGKAEQLTGLDLRDGADRLRLQLALTLAPLL